MKCLSFFTLLFAFAAASAQDQDTSATVQKEWNFSAELNAYFFPGEFTGIPVFKADHNRLHFEARYNYEDEKTFSAWAGYNFEGGKEFQYSITPMAAIVAGRSNGIAPGLELNFAFRKFDLYSESEYLFDVNAKENDFFYSWTDLSYAPGDFFWFGLSAQRTRLYQTELEIQRGLLVGGAYYNWELSGYLYNLFFDEPFVLLCLSANF